MSTPTEVYLERYHAARTRFREAMVKAADVLSVRLAKAREEFRQASQLYAGDPEKSPSARFNHETGAARVAYSLTYEKAEKRFKAEVAKAKEEAWGRP